MAMVGAGRPSVSAPFTVGPGVRIPFAPAEQELKNSVDLLDFARLFTIILIILAMVTLIDQFSAWLRRKLV